ncbi:MAG TPA: hypothetical protein VFY65_21195, partial [Longimicrobium sp.]|nr:hypothetical protein [Longimicrobium sp.]
MFIRTSVRARLALAAALALLSSACTDQLPTARAVPPPTGETVRAGIACTVAVAAGEVRCDALSGGGGSRNVILGGQNKYVRLASTDLAYDSVAGVFQMNVTVQSLLGQPMGTPDGTTATGVRVFFERLPAATSGTGEVTVNNADSVGAFTRLDQPYFEYPEILEPYGASRPRVWRFNVPKTVAAFSFAVYIDTELPAEQGALRWTHEWGYGTRVWTPFDAIWGASRGHVHAVAGRWILGLDSAGWSLRARAPGELYDVWGASRYEVYAAGDSGVVMRFDGNRWQTRRAPTAPHQLSGLWTDGGDLWAVGRRRDVPGGDVDGLILRSADDGQTWAETLSPGAGKRYLRDVFRVDGSVYVVGFEDPLVTGASPRKGVLLRSRDGGATWSDSLFSSPSGITFFSVWADGPDDVYIGGELLEAPRVRKTILMHSTDGGATWTTAPSIPGDVQNLWRVPGGRLYAAGSGGILVNDGGTWSQFEGGCVSLGAGWMGVWGSAENDLHAVANPDFAWRYDGTCWRSTSVQRGG